MTVADDRVADLGVEFDEWHRADAIACLQAADRLPTHVGDAQRLLSAGSPVMLLVLKLGVGQLPGAELESDADWAVAAAFARGEVLAYRDAGFDDASAARNLSLVDRICSMIGEWPEPDWSEAVGDRVTRMAHAAREGRKRGERLRTEHAGDGASMDTTAGWLSRHPSDHYFTQAFEKVTDPGLRVDLEQWISALEPSYEALAKSDWSAEQSLVDVVVSVRVADAPSVSWTEPANVIVVNPHETGAALGAALALRQVPDPDAPFNGKLFAMLPDEHWLVCGDRLEDDTILVRDGTRRIKTAS